MLFDGQRVITLSYYQWRRGTSLLSLLSDVEIERYRNTDVTIKLLTLDNNNINLDHGKET